MMQNIQENIQVGERIRNIRESLKMTREQFSEEIDISDVFLGQIERGERSLSIKTLVKIVNYSGFSSDYILFGDNRNNATISRINKLLNNCSNESLTYIYNTIHSFCNYVKINNKDL